MKSILRPDLGLQDPAYTPNRLLDETMWVLHCKTREQLARALEVDPALICRIWHRKSHISELLMVRIMDRTGWGICYVRELAGMPYDGPVYIAPLRPVLELPKAERVPPARENILQAMPGTVEELARKSGYSLCWVKKWVRKMRSGDPQARACHIIDWRPPTGPDGSGTYAPIYAAGPGEHVVYKVRYRKNGPRQRQLTQVYPQQNKTAQHSARQHAVT